MQKKIAIAAVGAAASLAAMAGCSSAATGANTTANSGSSAINAVQAAYSTASGDNTVTMTGTVKSPTTSEQMTGAMSFSPLELSMTVDMTGGAMSGSNVAVIYDGTSFYLKSPEFASFDGGKQWLGVNLTSLGSLGATVQSELNGLKNESPTTQLQPLLASGDLKDLGPATVNGTQTTHYSGTLDNAQVQALASVKGLTSAQLAQMKALLQQSGVSTETIDVWIDSHNLPVQETIVQNASSGATTTTLDFSNWGAPVSITAPPADQTGTFAMPGN